MVVGGWLSPLGGTGLRETREVMLVTLSYFFFFSLANFGSTNKNEQILDCSSDTHQHKKKKKIFVKTGAFFPSRKKKKKKLFWSRGGSGNPFALSLWAPASLLLSDPRPPGHIGNCTRVSQVQRLTGGGQNRWGGSLSGLVRKILSCTGVQVPEQGLAGAFPRQARC